ncbi:dimethylmenaquinone methyltransferase [Sulfolobus sp. C3]|nr:dimethylmenaquinone methyltransferase [Sulfolobus sp. C3]
MIQDFEEVERKLYSAVISDILDDLGYRKHVMSACIKPLRNDMRIIGRALPILVKEVKEEPIEPYKIMLEAISNIKPNNVVVIVSESKNTALWGELFSNAAKIRGSRGAIIDGYNRDTHKILSINFPVFSCGALPLDSKGRAEAICYNCRVYSGEAIIEPGDLIFADLDGVVVIPKNIEDIVISKALEKAKKEDIVRTEILKGSSLSEMWKKYRVL